MVEGELIAGHAGATHHLTGLGIHTEGGEGICQAAGVVAELCSCRHGVVVGIFLQQGDGGIAIDLLILCQFLLDGLADLGGGAVHLLLCAGLTAALGLVLHHRRLLVLSGCRFLHRGALLTQGGVPHLGGRLNIPCPLGEEGGCGGGKEGLFLHLPLQGDVNVLFLSLGSGLGVLGLFLGLALCHDALLLFQLRVGGVTLCLPLTGVLHQLTGLDAQPCNEAHHQQHQHDDGGHHFAYQCRARLGDNAAQRAAALQFLSRCPQGLEILHGIAVGLFAQPHMEQRAKEQGQHEDAEAPQHHRPLFMVDKAHAAVTQRQRHQIVAVAEQARQHLGEECQHRGIHAEIGHQHAQGQQQEHHADGQTQGMVIRRGLDPLLTAGSLLGGRLFCSCFLLCSCHRNPHLIAQSSSVKRPTAQQ